MRIFFLCAFFLISQQRSFGQDRQEIHCKHFFNGYPFGVPPTNDLIIRDIYALSNNDETKFADWVAYRLTMHEVLGELEVFRKWKADPWLDDAETLEPTPDSQNDYRNAYKKLDMERGHQAPLASFKGSRYASQTNYLSNITPQKSKMNKGPWKTLETEIRQLVKKGQTVYVMTGPLYETEMPILTEANEDHRIPSGYWKVLILITDEDAFEHAAFIVDQNATSADSLYKMKVTIDEVEKRSQLDLLWELEDDLENVIEKDLNEDWISTWLS